MAKKTYLITIVVLLLPATFANELIQTSRYTTTNTTIALEQDDLLQQVITIQFPQSIKTVGDAIEHLLTHSGYHLRQPNTQVVPVQYRLNQPLPIMHRRLGPTSLRSALQVLMGQSFTLREDPLYREINFIVKASVFDKVDNAIYYFIDDEKEVHNE